MATTTDGASMGAVQDGATELSAFTVAGHAFALPLAAVERVVPMVAITPLPQAPEVLAGVISVGGRVVPVVNLRRRFRLQERGATLADRLLLVRSSRRELALWVDDVSGVVRIAPQEIVHATELVPGIGQVKGIAGLAGGLVLIHDLDQCLALDEELSLSRAMADAQARA